MQSRLEEWEVGTSRHRVKKRLIFCEGDSHQEEELGIQWKNARELSTCTLLERPRTSDSHLYSCRSVLEQNHPGLVRVGLSISQFVGSKSCILIKAQQARAHFSVLLQK